MQTTNNSLTGVDLGNTGLVNWLHDNIEGFEGPFSVSRFEGGQSNPTFRIKAASGEYVLRRKPMGNVLPSAHAVDREFRVLSALGGTSVPVPPVHALCLDDDVIGSMFYVMDLVPGRTFWDPRLPDLSAPDRAAIFDSMNEVMAELHAIDPATIGLGEFGRGENYIARQIARWTKQYRASETVPNPAMDRLIEWLPDHMPPEGEIRIVHGDYRLDNVLIHPEEPRIVAVVDWELSTLGNPIADFAYHCMVWRFSPDLFRGLAGAGLEDLNIPSETTYLDLYFQRTGFKPPENWDFYIILGMFRIAAILQGVAKRAIDGTAADDNARIWGAKAVPISELAWAQVEDF